MPDLLDTQPTQKAAGYTVLARRYRSTTFDEVVGQEAIARTLKNAIERDKTAHAYLFTGTRGVGKTSMARIFAKALNATDELAEQEAIARAILRGEDIDVIEIDAASNTGVDNVRDLIANAGLMPARCPYKVYIIDEVHMLTKNAFNALLKIMEEPPSHVKFVLCTTEPEKVPATIQSRCQRFEFHNIPTARIAEHIRSVLANEQIEADDGVVLEVARLANGSMRDGLSLLDRLIAAGEGTLTADVLHETLGTPRAALVSAIVTACASGNPADAMQAAGELLRSGTSIEQALEALAEHLRNVLVAATCGEDSELLELFGESREQAIAHAQHFDAAAIVHMIALIEVAAGRIRGATISRALFDALIVRLALTDQVAMIPAILDGSATSAKPTSGQLGPFGADEKKKMVTSAPARAPETALPPRPEKRLADAVGPAGVEPKPVLHASPEMTAADIEAARQDPLVARTMELFNGKIIDVRDIDDRDDNPHHKDDA